MSDGHGITCGTILCFISLMGISAVGIFFMLQNISAIEKPSASSTGGSASSTDGSSDSDHDNQFIRFMIGVALVGLAAVSAAFWGWFCHGFKRDADRLRAAAQPGRYHLLPENNGGGAAANSNVDIPPVIHTENPDSGTSEMVVQPGQSEQLPLLQR